MKIEKLACRAEKILHLKPISEVQIPLATLVSIKVDNTHISITNFLNTAFLAAEVDTDRDYLTKIVSANSYLAEVLFIQNRTETDSGRISIRILEFDDNECWSEPKILGVDDRTVADVNRYRKRLSTTDEVIEWLSEQLILDSGDKFSVVAIGSTQISDDAFRILGSSIAADVQIEDDQLIIKRVTSKPRDTGQRLVLISGSVTIEDRTRMGLVSELDRAELRQLSKADNAFLAVWNEYSKLEQEAVRIASQDLGWADYDRFRIRGDGSIEFELIRNSNSENLLQLLSNGPIGLEASLSRTYLSEKQERSGFVIGEARKSDRGTVILRPDRNIKLEDLPSKGELYGIYTTDSIRITRRDFAQTAIAKAKTMPARQLSLILANRLPDPIGRGQRHHPLSPRVLKLLGGEPTPAQLEAIDLAINSKDIVLIQGPPGTGKTRVIAAIQARLSELGSGHLAVNKRVLFTSYQHDAVENLIQASSDGTLPAVKIGARYQGTDDDAYLNVWAEELRERLEKRHANNEPSELLQTLRRLGERVTAYRAQPYDIDGTVDLVAWISEVMEKVDVDLALKARKLVQRLNLEIGGGTIASLKKVEELARGLRISRTAFEDDGLERARAAALYPQISKFLDDSQRRYLHETAMGIDAKTGSEYMLAIRKALIDRVMDRRAAASIVAIRPEIASLLQEALAATQATVNSSTSDIDLAIEDFRDVVAHQQGSLKRALQTHTKALAATCQQSTSRLMRDTQNGLFDTVIIDEAARANPLDLMIPMSLANERLILVGDHRQLPQLLDESLVPKMNSRHSQTVVSDTLKVSMFERLFVTLQTQERTNGSKRTITLDKQFRMHPVLGNFISRNFYQPFGEILENGIQDPTVFKHGLQRYGEVPCGWIDVPSETGSEVRTGTSISRPAEARVIAIEISQVLKECDELTFGIITFYSGQVESIWQELSNVGLAQRDSENRWSINSSLPWMLTKRGLPRLRIGTVDAFQGREFDVVYLSATRSSSRHSKLTSPFGFLVLPNRLNVAMSRQRRLLIAVGDSEFLSSEIAKDAVPALHSFYELTRSKDGFFK